MTTFERYSLKQAAKLLRMDSRRLGEKIARGEIPGCFKEGARYYIFASALEAYVAGAQPKRPPFLVDVTDRRKAS